MITDASNHELDRLNQQAQEQRAAAGELGEQRVQLPDRPYGLAQGDEVLFASQHAVPGGQRVENGTRATVVAVDERTSGVRVRTEEPPPREVDVNTKELDGLRLAYAQHVYKAQGLTADRALVLTGGWQTDRERAYVAVSRAREQTDIYAAREDLGHQGIDSDAIDRLAERMSESRAQQASITRAQVEPARGGAGAVSVRRAPARRARPPARPRDRPLARQRPRRGAAVAVRAAASRRTQPAASAHARTRQRRRH